MGSNAKQIVEDSRREIVEQMLSMMEAGDLNWHKGWSAAALLPNNPVSGAVYRGGNRFRLMFEAMINGYEDPRYMTFVQAKQMGWHVKKGESGVLCEKWIFEKMIEQENPITGQKEKVVVELDHPVVSYFYLYHASQIEGIPEYELPNKDHPLEEMIETLIRASPCLVEEKLQASAYYSPMEDKIVMPPRDFFKSDADFIKTLAHEEVHSTGAEGRLNRPIRNAFGTTEYAKEELRAELGSLFLTSDLGLPSDGAVAENTAAYLQSWISVLKKDPDELFKAASDAEKAVSMLHERFELAKKKEEPKQEMTEEVAEKETIYGIGL